MDKLLYWATWINLSLFIIKAQVHQGPFMSWCMKLFQLQIVSWSQRGEAMVFIDTFRVGILVSNNIVTASTPNTLLGKCPPVYRSWKFFPIKYIFQLNLLFIFFQTWWIKSITFCYRYRDRRKTNWGHFHSKRKDPDTNLMLSDTFTGLGFFY